MSKINKIKVNDVEYDISLTNEEGKSIVESNLLTKTAVPNSGYVDKVYFNTSLTQEEIINICNGLVYEAGSYLIISNSENTNALAVINDENNNPIFIAQAKETEEIPLWVSESVSEEYGLTAGWQEFTNPIEMNFDTISEIPGANMTIGSQNDLIKDLVYVQSEKYSTVEKVESYIYEKEPIAVPSSGEVKTVYFNTDLTPTEVDSYLSKLTYVDFDGLQVSVLFSNATLTNVIFTIKFPDEGVYQIIHSNNIAEKQFTEIYDFSFGWNYDKWEINDMGISEAMGLPIGAENDIVKNVVNIGYEKEEKYVTKNDLYLKDKGTVVPNSGYVDKLYFNTNMSINEVKKLLDKVGGSTILYKDTTCNINTLAYNGEYSVGNFRITSSVILYFVYVDGTTEVTRYGFSGWNPDFNGVVEIGGENSGTIEYMKNDQLTTLVSITPFTFGNNEKYVSKDYLDEYMKNNFENGNEGSY